MRLVLLLVFVVNSWAQITSLELLATNNVTVDTSTINKNHWRAKTITFAKKKRALITYLKKLRGKQSKRVVLGQQGDHKKTDFSLPYGATGFDYVYDELAELFDNRRHPGYIGVDIGGLGYQNPNLAGKDLLFYGSRRHIVTAVFHPRNPWTGGDIWDTRNVNIPELLPGGKRRKQWVAYLNTIVKAIKPAERSGVVLLRPFQEMNADFFWWGHLPKNEYVSLYRDVHKLFTARLKNLLFIYSPNNQYNISVKPYEFYYPGSKFADIIGVDVYEDAYQNQPFTIHNYNTLKSLAGTKPLIAAELGPGRSDGEIWWWNMLDALKEYPEIVMALAWNDWGNNDSQGTWSYKSIRGNHYDGSLDHPLVICKEDLPRKIFR